jgi:DNA polymerase
VIAARLDRPADLGCWRDAARALVAARVPPEDVAWTPGLLATEPMPEAIAPPELRVPRAFVELAEIVLRHRDSERHALLYQALWRITHGERALLDDATDALVLRLEGMQRAVIRDAHKMHAFVRFRATPTPDGDTHHIAWYEPEHLVLEAEAPFFVRRFAQLRWSILTPDGSAHWNRAELTFGPPGERAQVPPADAGEELWRAYYASIFNPARLKPAAMRQHMPKKFWRNLPEARDIPRLVQEAPARVEAMVARGFSEPALVRQSRMYLTPQPRVEEAMPDDLFTRTDDPAEALAALRAELEADDFRDTNLVFGEGRLGSALMFVGEQPGDEEDRQKRPFVGPAGRLFNRALEDVGIPRDEAYVTNAVKRFKYVMQGGRRIHQTPDAGDIKHYRPFLLRELDLVKPRLLVTLGATALKTVTGKAHAVTKVRGELMDGPEGLPLFPTVHPSYLLRLPDEESKRREWGRFLEDLKRVKREVM